MSITIYSFLSAVICFDVFILIGSVFQRQVNLFLGYNYYPVLFILILGLCRIFIPVEFKNARIIRDYTVLPAMQTILQTDVSVFGRSVSIIFLIVAVSAVVSVILLMKLLIAMRTDWQKLKTYTVVTDERILKIMDDVAQNNKRNYQIILTKQKVSPAIWCYGKPTIIIPRQVLSMSDEEIFYIFKHEWQHFKEKDSWYKLMIRILCALMWWNPVIYILRHDMRQTFELRCDLNVTKNMQANERDAYIDVLLMINSLMVQGKKEQLSNHTSYIAFTGVFAATYNEKLKQCAMQDYLRKVDQRNDLIDMYCKRNRMIGIFSMAIVSLLFAASFAFLVQPASFPSTENFAEQVSNGQDVVVSHELTSKNAYIVEHQDGTHSLYRDDKFIKTLSTTDLSQSPHNTLPIVKE